MSRRYFTQIYIPPTKLIFITDEDYEITLLKNTLKISTDESVDAIERILTCSTAYKSFQRYYFYNLSLMFSLPFSGKSANQKPAVYTAFSYRAMTLSQQIHILSTATSNTLLSISFIFFGLFNITSLCDSTLCFELSNSRAMATVNT